MRSWMKSSLTRTAFSLMMVLLAVAFALLPARAGAAPMSSSSGVSGTACASSATQTLSVAALSDQKMLQPFYTTVIHGGYVAGGTGLRNRGFGSITISGMPTGSYVKNAFLFWDILGGPTRLDTEGVGQINGTTIHGTLTGTGGDPCWGNSANYAYTADVTSLVAGNGVYSLSGFASGTTNGQDPWLAGSAAPMAEGASLVVVYVLEGRLGGVTTTIQLYRGSTMFAGGSASQTIALPTPTTGSSQTTFITADGQTGTGTKTATANGVLLPSITLNGTDPQAGPPYSNGNLWDTQTADTSSAMPNGTPAVTLSVNFQNDCQVWVGQVIAYH